MCQSLWLCFSALAGSYTSEAAFFTAFLEHGCSPPTLSVFMCSAILYLPLISHLSPCSSYWRHSVFFTQELIQSIRGLQGHEMLMMVLFFTPSSLFVPSVLWLVLTLPVFHCFTCVFIRCHVAAFWPTAHYKSFNFCRIKAKSVVVKAC